MTTVMATTAKGREEEDGSVWYGVVFKDSMTVKNNGGMMSMKIHPFFRLQSPFDSPPVQSDPILFAAVGGFYHSFPIRWSLCVPAPAPIMNNPW